MKTYKYSLFNLIIQQTPKYVILYNTYSLKYRIFNKEEHDIIFCKSNIQGNLVLQQWIEQGFIVSSELDEIQRLKDDIDRYWKEKDVMTIFIVVTMACNYRCSYCFENGHLCNTEHMSKETADDIITFIKRKYKEHKFKNKLQVEWFGGEPLLNMPVIRYISKELRNNSIDYDACMYTNGKLLTKDIALELKELGVNKSVVITLDGLAPTYAKLKHCREEDFYTVLENIQAVKDILDILIRINVSADSKNDIEELYKILTEEY